MRQTRRAVLSVGSGLCEINALHFVYKYVLKYENGNYPCGNEDQFVGKSIAETIKHCKEVHKYDLVELLELIEQELKK